MFTKTKLTLGLTMAAVMVTGVFAPEDAMAHKRKHKHKHHRTTTHRSAHYSESSALASKVEMLEAQLRATQDEVTALRAGGGAAAAGADSAKVQELDTWMQETKAKPKAKDNMVFFRGGYADQDHTRSGVSIPEAARPLGVQRGDDQGFYIGAGFDFSLDDSLFGLMDNTEVLAELMFEWKDYGRSKGVGVSTDGTATANGLNATLVGKNVSVSQFTLSAAPKIKFMKGSAFRPWIIPIGFAAHVISPPSEAITVFNPGMMFGGGMDYNIWRNLYVGADARYHLTSRSGDGVNTDGFTAGGYLGIGF
jgi:opacity protein-like surface antigen